MCLTYSVRSGVRRLSEARLPARRSAGRRSCSGGRVYRRSGQCTPSRRASRRTGPSRCLHVLWRPARELALSNMLPGSTCCTILIQYCTVLRSVMIIGCSTKLCICSYMFIIYAGVLQSLRELAHDDPTMASRSRITRWRSRGTTSPSGAMHATRTSCRSSSRCWTPPLWQSLLEAAACFVFLNRPLSAVSPYSA